MLQSLVISCRSWNFNFQPLGSVATTTGITASAPMILTLVEAVAGRAKAAVVAAGLGLTTWDARHVSAAFGISRGFTTTALANRLAVWHHETLALAGRRRDRRCFARAGRRCLVAQLARAGRNGVLQAGHEATRSGMGLTTLYSGRPF